MNTYRFFNFLFRRNKGNIKLETLRPTPLASNSRAAVIHEKAGKRSKSAKKKAARKRTRASRRANRS